MRIFEVTIKENPVLDNPTVTTPTEVPLNSPGGATVMILNDHVTPAEVVAEAVAYGAGLDMADAWERVHAAHRQGWNPIASYANRDIAETVANRIEQHARQNTRYDHYRRYVNFYDPWPLAAEVMDAEQ